MNLCNNKYYKLLFVLSQWFAILWIIITKVNIYMCVYKQSDPWKFFNFCYYTFVCILDNLIILSSSVFLNQNAREF